MKKPKYIKKIENSLGLMFSRTEVKFSNGLDIIEFINKRSYEVVWSSGYININDEKMLYNEKIFKTKQNFYLYLNSSVDFVIMDIYYKEDQKNELQIFIKQLLKQYKNERIN